MSQPIFDIAKDGTHSAGIVFINLVKTHQPTPTVGGSTVLAPLAPVVTVTPIDGVGYQNEQANAAISSMAFDSVNGVIYMKIANAGVAADWKALTHAA